MNNPSVSVILPTYNVGKYISRCLDSCLSQNYDDFEIIIVDDCGSDNSIEIAEVYAAKDKRIRIIKNKNNMGTYHARRVGVENATGEYIVFLDPDDELAEDALLTIYNEIRKNPGTDLLLFNVQYNPELKFWQKKPIVPIGFFKNNVADNVLKEKALSYGTAGKVYSKELLIKGFDCFSIPESIRLVYGEDILIFAGALFNAKKAIGFNEYCYVYHINESSITKKLDSMSINNNIEQLNLVVHYLKNTKRCGFDIKNIQIFVKKAEIDKLFFMKVLAENSKEHLKFAFSILSKRTNLRTAAQISASYFNFLFSKI